MEHVFLSYSRRDTKIMQRVRDTLMKDGIVVWTDETLVPGTPSWMDAIEDAIDRADALVVLLTPHAKKSRWVKEEMRYAEMQEVRIFPLLAGGTEKTAIPFGFITAQHLDIRSDDAFYKGMTELIWAMKIYLGLETLADPDYYESEPSEWTEDAGIEPVPAEDEDSGELEPGTLDIFSLDESELPTFDPDKVADAMQPPLSRSDLMDWDGAAEQGIVRSNKDADAFDILDNLEAVDVDDAEADRLFDPDALETIVKEIQGVTPEFERILRESRKG